jgi:uncharacterized membrane protein YhaH (DUF805 family)
MKPKIWSFKGRTSKNAYIGWAALYLLVVLGPTLLAHGLGLSEMLSAVLTAVFAVPASYLMIPISARRLHDVGVSGWWLLAFFVPVGNFLLMWVLGFTDGANGPNRFGPPAGRSISSPHGPDATATAVTSPAEREARRP